MDVGHRGIIPHHKWVSGIRLGKEKDYPGKSFVHKYSKWADRNGHDGGYVRACTGVSGTLLCGNQVHESAICRTIMQRIWLQVPMVREA